MRTSLFAVPYHLGRKEIGVGAGPRHMLAGAGDARHEIHPDRLPDNEVDAIVAVNAALAAAVRRSTNSLPIIVSGDCNSCLGTLSGLGSSHIGIIWFDAHGDMNTPETSPSGFFDGMSISIALGDCYPDVWSRLGNTHSIPSANVLLVTTQRAIERIGARFRIRAAALTNYNPDFDVDGKTLTACRELFRAITDAASSPARNPRPASS
jgi:arginase